LLSPTHKPFLNMFIKYCFLKWTSHLHYKKKIESTLLSHTSWIIF
jgi:hypothetical protein